MSKYGLRGDKVPIMNHAHALSVMRSRARKVAYAREHGLQVVYRLNDEDGRFHVRIIDPPCPCTLDAFTFSPHNFGRILGPDRPSLFGTIDSNHARLR